MKCNRCTGRGYLPEARKSKQGFYARTCPKCGGTGSVHESKPVSVLSIEAWRDGSGWTWNSWHKVGTVGATLCDAPPRELFATMRAEGFLGDGSKGRVCVEDDQYNLVICARGTGEPLFAIAYGEAQ